MKSVKRIVKKYFDDIVGNGVYDIFKFVVFLIISQLIPTGVFVAIKQYFTSNQFLLVIITAILSMIAGLIFLLIYKAHRKFKYKIISIEDIFEYDIEKITLTSKSVVKPKRRGLDRIYNHYSWFPDEKSSVRCLTKGYKIKRLPKKDLNYEYDILFGKTVKKGIPLHYSERIIGENKNRHFKNFYSRNIISPIDSLKITLIIPSKYNVNKIYTEEIFRSHRDELSTPPKEIDFSVSYTWEIPDPKVGWKYKISW